MNANARKMLSVSLALLLCMFVCAGCFRIRPISSPAPGPQTEPQTGNDGPEEPGPGSAPAFELNFTLENVYEQNLISNLLRWHDSVTFRQDVNGYPHLESFWLRDGDRVMISMNSGTYEDGTTYEARSGSYRGFDFYDEDEGAVTAGKWVTAEELVTEDWIDTYIAEYLPARLDGDIKIIAEDGDLCTVEMNEILESAEEGSVPCKNTMVLNKYTLDIQSYEWEYTLEGTTYIGSFCLEYDGEKLGEDLLSAWDETRTVTVEVASEAAGERTETFEFPTKWNLTFLPDEGISLICPEYGNIENNVFLPNDTADVTVYGYDTANLPTGEDSGGETLSDLPFSFDDMVEANRITNLTDKYGTVNVEENMTYGTVLTSFFRQDGTIVRHAEATVSAMDYGLEASEGESFRTGYGSIGKMRYEFSSESGFLYYAPLSTLYDEEDYLFVDKNAKGEHYDNDLYLTESLLFGQIESVEQKADGTVVFRYRYDYDETGEEIITYTVSAQTLEIKSILMGDGSAITVLPGDEVPFAEELKTYFSDTREFLCHFSGDVDMTYEVPSAWEFTVGYYDDVTCYSDEARKQEVENRFPADGQNREIWVKAAMG